MSDLRKRFTDEMKESMKAGDSAKTGTIRLIIAALKEKDINARGAGKGQAEEGEILSMLQSMVKQRQESLKIYQDNNRADLAEKEQGEIAVIETFLPKQMSDAEVDAALAQVIAQTGASSIKDMGKVMAEVKAKYAGQMDMAKASAQIKTKLAG